MTSTISLRWAFNAHDLQRFEKEIDNFKDEIRPVIKSLAPEYVDSLESMHPYMMFVLIDTLKHWKSRPHIPFQIRQRFIDTKIIECLAFWKGFLDSGGEFPLIIINNDAIEQIEQKAIDNNKAFHNNIVAVIPIGRLNHTTEQILMATVNTLNDNKNIKSIYCVFDGTQPEKKLFLDTSKKVQILESTSNQGPAMARNLGIEEAMAFGMSDALFLDSDITITSTILDELLQSYDKSQFGIYCPAVKADGDQWLDIYHDFSGTLNGRYFVEQDTERLLFGTTSCMMVPQQIFEDGIKFSKDFSMAAGEDIDFCLQLYHQGYPIYPMDTIAVKHWYGNNCNQTINWDHFKSRFYRYGVGESIVTRRNPNYYNLLSRTMERILI